MRIRHTQKVRGFTYKPNDKPEPGLGTIVQVPDALGVALISRGWGEDADGKVKLERYPKPKEETPLIDPKELPPAPAELLEEYAPEKLATAVLGEED